LLDSNSQTAIVGLRVTSSFDGSKSSKALRRSNHSRICKITSGNMNFLLLAAVQSHQ